MNATDYLRHEHHEFLAAADAAMANADLQGVLSRLADTLGVRNRAAWNEFAAADSARQRAREIKDETLAELDRHLETLATSVERNGGRVHWAQDGAAACRTVIDVLQKRNARRVVKSKSMTTEEIHLNRALADAGVETIETDLGEYIIQLAGHRPSHIVGPALHLNVQNIAEILSSVAGRALSTDRFELTQLARRVLREKFSQADAGITGVNFAIAETGTIVLVSNEGNARLTTTLPKLHVAIMGMEKVIPRMADLPVFLKILARAATGQKLSVYTSLLNGSRKPGELDGAEEFHLVILDNGRSRILGGPLRESLFCIRCGACLNACPIYRNIGGHAYGGVYSGPIGAVLTPLYDGLAAHKHLPHASSLCGACQAACPVKIQIPQMLIRLREQLHQPHAGGRSGSRLESLAYRFWAMTLRRPRLYRLMTFLQAQIAGRLKRNNPWMHRLPGKLSGWTSSRDFPAPAPRRFRDWWSDERRA
jgi:L-lactate dehydrogenase complex protein LldF